MLECDYPDCFRFFETFEKLNSHKIMVHNIQLNLESTLLRPDFNPMMRFPMVMPMMGNPMMMQMPMQNYPPTDNN